MSLLSKLGFTATYVNTLVCTLNDAKVLDNQFLRISTRELENSKKIVQNSTIVLYNGNGYGARCRVDIMEGRRRTIHWASFYEGNDWNKDVPVEDGSTLTEEEMKRVALLFKDNGEKLVLNVILADEELSSAEKAIEILKIK